MAIVHAGSVGAATPLTASTANGLYNVQIENSELFRVCAALAPRSTVAELEAQGLTLSSVIGLDLSQGVDYTAEIDWTAPLPLTRLEFDRVTWRAGRYAVGKVQVPDVVEAANMARAQVSTAAAAMMVHSARARALYARLVTSALTTTGNYASGHASDAGDHSAASAAWITLLRGMRDKLVEKSRWDASMARVGVSADVADAILVSDEFAASPTSRMAGNNQDPALVPSFIAGVLRMPVDRVHVVEGVYTDASGTVTDMMTEAIALTIDSPEHAFLRTITPDDGQIGSLRISERDEENESRWFFADLKARAAVQDSQSGVLRYDLLSS